MHRASRHHRASRAAIHWVKIGVLTSLLLGIIGLSAFFVWAATIQIPDFSLFTQRKISQSTKIYDRTGKILLYDVHRDVRRTVVSFDDINLSIKNASVAIEDDKFYQHFGIEPTAILRAVLVNLGLRQGYAGQGGSTITQQVIKNALLSSEKTITRKLKEWILAIKLERMMSKEDVLTLYLNEAPYGGNVYGVEEASLSFFGKHAKDVTLAESAYLAALPQAPTTYSPYGTHTDKLEARKNFIIDKMLTLGMITQPEHDEAKKEKVKFITPDEQGIRAPHFVMFVKQELADMYGEDAITDKGFRVITTIDMDLETQAEAATKKWAATNEKTFNAHNAAIVAIDPKTGQILAMAGSRDYFDTENEGNFNITLAHRQPGSSFKPFVYALAFEKGYTPDTMVFDVPTNFSTYCDAAGNPQNGADASKCYMPENYDHVYRGPISFRNALAQSINVPAVKVLYLVGVDPAIEFAERLGIKSLTTKERYGLTLVLGGGEVSLLDMTSAYGVFANNGKRNPYEGILRVEDADGNLIKEFSTDSGQQVIAPEIAHMISDVLSDNAARAPAFGPQSYLYFPDRQVAVKTGTTNDYRDAWIIGYTPTLVVGAWAGNNDNTPMEKKVAGFIVAPMWNEFFTNAFTKIPDEKFPSPPAIGLDTKPALRGIWYGGQSYIVDRISQKLATPYTPEESKEEIVIADPHEILHWVNKNDPTGGAPINPGNDSQYFLWEIPAQNWIKTEGLPSSAKIGSIPTGFDNIHTPESAPHISILSPTTTSIYGMDDVVSTILDLSGTFPTVRVDYVLDGIFLSSIRTTPFIFNFTPKEYIANIGTHTLSVTAFDVVGNHSETTVTFTTQ